MPGYEVKGFTWDKWKHFDALHCRTRAIFDRQLLRLEHPVLPKVVPFSDRGHAITVTIEDMANEGIDAEKCLVKFRKDLGEWESISLLPLHSENRWVAIFPAFPVGTIVDYQVIVQDQSGRVATHPRMAPEIFHHFTVSKSE